MMDELTKIGNLFDTIKINYCVFGSYALMANGIRSKGTDCVVLTEGDQKSKIIEMIFKLNYTIMGLTEHQMKIKKSTSNGDLIFVLEFGVFEDKSFKVNLEGKELLFSKKLFDGERREVWGYYRKGAGAKGYFKTAPLEELYFSKMNSDDESDISDLEMIKGSGKLNVERLVKILKRNGLV